MCLSLSAASASSSFEQLVEAGGDGGGADRGVTHECLVIRKHACKN